MPLTTLQEIASGLNKSRLQWQRTGEDDTRAGAKRHESIEACIDWSCQLLPEPERNLYPLLGVFPADFSIEAAKEICGISKDLLIRWIRFHLLTDVSGRCLLSPVLREFAARRIPDSHVADVRAGFVAHYLALAQKHNDMNRIEDRNCLRLELRNLHTAADTLREAPSDSAIADNLVWFGNALWRVPVGVRSENMLKAIGCYAAALKVYTQKDFPRDWAMTQNNLGTAYGDLPVGDRGENLVKAIACYEAALQVRTQQEFPMDYGHSHVCLGNAYAQMGEKERAKEHFRNAVEGYAAAGLPSEWEWRAYAERRLREL